MKRLAILGLVVAAATLVASPVAAGKPAPAVAHSACSISQTDADGTWPGRRVTVDWSRLRVDRVIVELYIAEQPADQHVAWAQWRKDYLGRAQRSGTQAFDLWPMKFWNVDVSAYAAGTFRDYHVTLKYRGVTVSDSWWSEAPVTIPPC